MYQYTHICTYIYIYTYQRRHKRHLRVRTSETHLSPPHCNYLYTYIQLAFTDVCIHISEALVKAGARVDLRNAASASPLHLAAQKSHPGVVRVLIAAGADRAQRDSQVYVCCSVLQCVVVC